MIRYLLSFLVLTGSAWATSITIGQLEYLSTNQQGISGYKVIFNTSGVTAQPLTFASVTLSVGGRHETIGPITTPPTPSILFTGGPGLGLPACPCTSLRLQLVFPGNTPVTFMLANGELFTASRVNLTVLLPQSGNFLMPGASTSVVLTAVPEPQTWLLIGIGLLAAWPHVRQGIRKKQTTS